MFPLRDNVPRVNTPLAVYFLILANAVVFLLMLGMPEQGQVAWFYLFGFVPARFFSPDWAGMVGFPAGGWYAFLTYMFLHSGWAHVLLNMWSLWIFGDNIEDIMGGWRFLLFYVLCGLAALWTHLAFNLHSQTPILGASGAIAGVMGAYFMLYPHARVLTLIPIFIFPYFVDIPAMVFLGFWFLLQLVSGVSSGLATPGGAGIAWWAHAGGFIAGMALLPFFRRKGHCYYCYNRASKNYDMVKNE